MASSALDYAGAPVRNPQRRRWLLVVSLLALAAVALSLHGLLRHLPPGLWWNAAVHPSASDTAQLLVHHAWLPRLAVSLLAGAALGLSGALLQSILRNPLADASTLGISAGANLMLVVGLLFAPGLLDQGRTLLTSAGGGLAMLLVFALAWRQALAPLAVVLAGLIIGLYCGALGSIMVLFNHEYLGELFVWQTGNLAQNGWGLTRDLTFSLIPGMLAALLLVRPLDVLQLSDESARSLGLSLSWSRTLGLALAVFLSTTVVSHIGMVAFVGLAAPALARLLGARRLRQQLWCAPLFGALLLWLADQVIQNFAPLLPTGTATALLGAPLLLWLLPQMRRSLHPPRSTPDAQQPKQHRPARILAVSAMALVVCLGLALTLAPGPSGWAFSSVSETLQLLPWRAPRLFAAMAAGAMLAMAGTMIQRTTGNAMASPEVLGVSSGAALGVIVVFLANLPLNPGIILLTASAGALITLLILLSFGWRHGFSPERLLLTGIALATISGAFSSIILVSGDPRLGTLLSWMAGSTYRVTTPQALVACAVAVVGMALAPLIRRWLDLLALGPSTASMLGLNLGRSRLALLALTALLTGAATLVVGPLSFVGLMAPHMARLLGLRRALVQLYGAALLGALLMVVADWLGRTLIFPWQIPAGLLATFVGGPYFMWLMIRRRGGA